MVPNEETESMPRYIPQLRPPSFCTLPAGLNWDFVELPGDSSFAWIKRDLPRSVHRYGVISTDRPLTAEELDRFSLRLAPTSEPTDQGNQYVIPGCEHDWSRGTDPQGRLF